MRNWLATATENTSLPVVCELGPPEYAVTHLDTNSQSRVEISDRWNESLQLKALLKETWELAVLTNKRLSIRSSLNSALSHMKNWLIEFPRGDGVSK
ncbi:hypothetical protein ACFQZR_13815 [Paenibacillus sp. GCM10027629]|uniref:hypothetical protein n=1 Tax=Paenibacillus sp. GCM10027629 TaxID=3273414 RepID=UPI0036365B64